MHSRRFSTSSPRLTRKQPRCSWHVWESSEPSQRMGQMSCVGSTGSSSDWWGRTSSPFVITTTMHTLHCLDCAIWKAVKYSWLRTSPMWCTRFWQFYSMTVFKQWFVCFGFSVKSSANSIKRIRRPSDCQNRCPSTHRWTCFPMQMH